MTIICRRFLMPLMQFQPVLNINNAWLNKNPGQVRWKITNNHRQRQ
ncbi:Uncharacterised protein [Klebsiella michiganensis]|uniref:Uncharacterized protein n=1 Tax=Klebsiella michiganensis TaxID=1134687 RepID=A0ABR5GDQ5_9ENTR|nr:hypothetical protein L387_04565 [Klebsiella michiganensis]KLY33980.1 hypothetical protein SK91_02877 [Klebsiella michiganensis]OUG37365.1 hypothetical protein AZ036_004621 [Klebsiella michiganensis]STV72152.1 Uncharacterised protein [Klebsiella michiganensis]